MAVYVPAVNAMSFCTRLFNTLKRERCSAPVKKFMRNGSHGSSTGVEEHPSTSRPQDLYPSSARAPFEKLHERHSEGPDAVMRGNITVTDSDAFTRLLSHGIGRHRAYGYGMLLLRPTR